MVTPIRKKNPQDELIEELSNQLSVSNALLVKILQKYGDIDITAEDLEKDIEESVTIDLELNEETDVWTVSLKAVEE